MRGELEQVRQEQTTTLELLDQSESRTGTQKSVVVEDDEFSVDVMRDQIVTLALALETSELDRADAMDRIGRERKDNADSLKRLGLLVKRFYSTLSCVAIPRNVNHDNSIK
jgi:Mg2+ and Co2+ transporter CorA